MFWSLGHWPLCAPMMPSVLLSFLGYAPLAFIGGPVANGLTYHIYSKKKKHFVLYKLLSSGPDQ